MRRLLYSILVFIVLGCAEEVIEKPKDLLPKEKMVDVIYDVAVLQAIKSTNRSVAQEFDNQVMQLVYKIHNIDSAQFANSDVYYASIPQQYENIYETVQARLEKNKEFLEEQRKKKSDSAREGVKSRTDSIKKANQLKKAVDSLPEKDVQKDE
ncbi:DUF4296 domain-containing protein [Allomuricauda sp. d1]|uniref:DUF4296 domain-containing protein n=1 Tax=Allomuricauda sp. d1 TaxID=3136725 RepID=UPI0031D3BEF6